MVKISSWSGKLAEGEEQERFYTYGQVGRGWHSLLDEIFKVLPEDAVVVQVKEKFGGLRFYVSHSNEEADEKIRWAEAQSYKICEVCGEPGVCESTGNWLSTLCPTHRKEVEEGKKKWMYREEEKNAKPI